MNEITDPRAQRLVRQFIDTREDLEAQALQVVQAGYWIDGRKVIHRSRLANEELAQIAMHARMWIAVFGAGLSIRAELAGLDLPSWLPDELAKRGMSNLLEARRESVL
jgi:hypothetical protein